MNKADLENDYLLNEQRIIWLAEDVEAAVMERIAAQIAYLRDRSLEPIHIYFQCDGGDSGTGLGLANLVKRDGNIYGWVLGDSASAAATIWASCAKRYIFANAKIGIHPVQRQWSSVTFDADKAAKWVCDMRSSDEKACEIYAAASAKSSDWWWERMHQPGDVKWIEARELVCIGMAEKAEGSK